MDSTIVLVEKIHFAKRKINMKENNLKHTINLIVGDYSGDGHDRKEVETILSNLDISSFKKAYVKGSELVGVDITSLCEDYDDNHISEEYCKLLKDAGLDFEIDSGYTMCSNDFLGIYLFLVKKGNENFEYEQYNENHDDIYIGGYGLFE